VQVREYEYDAEKQGQQEQSTQRLKREVEGKRTQLEQWSSTAYGEVLFLSMIWIWWGPEGAIRCPGDVLWRPVAFCDASSQFVVISGTGKRPKIPSDLHLQATSETGCNRPLPLSE